MQLWTINGKPFDHHRIDADPKLGAVELWKIRAENVQHPFHIHLAAFQVVSIGGNDPGPYNHGWKDTVSLDNGDFAELLVKFDGFRGMYVFHCHNPEREDMMRWESSRSRDREPIHALIPTGDKAIASAAERLMVTRAGATKVEIPGGFHSVPASGGDQGDRTSRSLIIRQSELAGASRSGRLLCVRPARGRTVQSRCCAGL